MKLSEIIELYTLEDVLRFVKRITKLEISDKKEYEQNVLSKYFKPIGDNVNNGASIDLLQDGEKGIIERLTNSIDAFIEKTVEVKSIRSPENVDSVIKHGFPQYYQNLNSSYDLSSEVIDNIYLVAQNGSKRNVPTLDIVDLGTGIEGSEFSSTILSLHSGNKTNKDKSYLIGAFGHGGSTSLSFCGATMVISKFNHKYYFTVVLRIHLRVLKTHTYFYLNVENKIPEIDSDIKSTTQRHLKALMNSDSGTLIRMVDVDMDLKLRQSAFTNPGKMMDFLSTELFDTKIPITLIENREEFSSYGEKNLVRTIRGSKIKLFKSKNRYKSGYSGSFEVKVENDVLTIDYYTVLPTNEDDWANDTKAKEDYVTFNYHEKPIIFTANGQYINGENYTRLKNKGISFLNYRLIIHVNLDQLGTKKQGLFTSNRSSIKNSSYVTKLLDQIVYQASINKDIISINDLIAEKSLDQSIDIDVEGLEEDLKSTYLDFLKSTDTTKFRKRHSIKPSVGVKDDLNDFIEILIISNTRVEYYKDETIRIILKTNADKYSNKIAQIDGFLNEKFYSNWEISYMNGRIQYNIQGLKPGEYNLNYLLFNDVKEKELIATSNQYRFIVIDEKTPNENQDTKKDLNIKIDTVEGKDLIINISKNASNNLIHILVCLDHPLLNEIIKGKNSSEIKQNKKNLINPLALYALLLDDLYEDLEVESKNKLILNHAKVFLKYRLS